VWGAVVVVVGDGGAGRMVLSSSTVFWAVDDFRASFTASLAVSGVSAGVWVLDKAQVIVSEVVAAEVAAVVGSGNRWLRVRKERLGTLQRWVGST
jgi:hypothetical protein